MEFHDVTEKVFAVKDPALQTAFQWLQELYGAADADI
jgi:hypothetical protein